MPDVPPAVFFRLACTLPWRRSSHQNYGPRAEGQGASSTWTGRVSSWSSVTLSRESVHPRVGRLHASGSAGADPSCPKTDVTHEPRDAASPASTASSPANVTIALAPLIGAGQRENNPIKGYCQQRIGKNVWCCVPPQACHSGARPARCRTRTSATPLGVAGNPDMFSAKHHGIPGSVRSASRSVLPRNDDFGSRSRALA